MPNIVVIDDVKKVVQEFATFIKQMGEDYSIQGVDSPDLFLKLYNSAIPKVDDSKTIEYLVTIEL